MLFLYSRNQQRERSRFEIKPPSSAKSSRRKSGRKSTRSSQDKMESSTPSITSSRMDNDSHVLGSRLKDIENELKTENMNSRNVVMSDLIDENLKHSSQKPPSAISRKKSDFQTEEPTVKPHVDSSKSRPKSAKSRPQTGTRAQSRQGQQSRATSRQGSRPSSRATSRAMSRAET